MEAAMWREPSAQQVTCSFATTDFRSRMVVHRAKFESTSKNEPGAVLNHARAAQGTGLAQ